MLYWMIRMYSVLTSTPEIKCIGFNILAWRRIRSLLLLLLTFLVLLLLLSYIKYFSISYRSEVTPTVISINQSGVVWGISSDRTKSTAVDVKLKLSYRVHGFYYAWYDAPKKLSIQNSLISHNWTHWNHRRLKHWNVKVASGYSIEPHFPPYLIASSFYPKLGPYSSRDLDIIHIHMEMSRFSGIGVLVVSWYPNGMSDENGKPVDDLIFPLLNIANQYDIKICLHFEPYKNRDTNTIVEDLKYIYEKGYTSHPAYYRIPVYQSVESKLLPVVYVYDSYRIEPSKWRKILHPNEKATIRNKVYNAFLIGLLLESDDCSKLSESAFNGGYTYFVGNGISKASSPNAWEYLSKECLKYNLTFYPSIGPGYEDVSIRPWNDAATQTREFGHTFSNAFNKAINAKPTGIGIVSFNEWHEGTQIEPSIPFKWTGYLTPSRVYKDYLPYSPEFYLRLTRLIVNRFEGIDTLPERFTQASEVELSQLYALLKKDKISELN
ncbi:hypothetical protein MN116_007671 [Schistosoma mekongi]|uniref:Glycoprotein endo-alpha-1,2-mannosidase n=1 Tax=Schistosoma mekongi TaxID=38744 RepID=A0AAE1Z706_SCHME|nr:hypothetical protein MN116_007671 [Schistosoma mekongi]